MRKRIDFIDKLFDVDLCKITTEKVEKLTALIEQFDNILNDFIESEEI